MLTVGPISDVSIVSMLAENNSSAWEQLYDKYAPMMYGAIVQTTKDERIAEQIFKECFFQLKENKNISKIRGPLDAFLLKHTYSFTANYLKLMELTNDANKFNNNRHLVQLLSSRQISIKTELQSEKDQKDARKKLREEFNHLRKQHQHRLDTLF
ncbi:MAG: RNA polymerase sigma factor [Bacteroidota bacterium]